MPVDPTPQQISALGRSPHQGPVQMVNLLQFKPDGGVESYRRYAVAAQSHLEATGARVVSLARAAQVVIGEDERPWWDEILTVEYPSVQAFLEMVMSPGYQAITHLRSEALSRAELIATAPQAP